MAKTKKDRAKTIAKYRRRKDTMNVFERINKSAQWKEMFFTKLSAVRRTKIIFLCEKQDHKCHYCGVEMSVSGHNKPTIDHIHPLAKGGTDNIKNLVAACSKCNSRKGNMSYEYFMDRCKRGFYNDLDTRRERRHLKRIAKQNEPLDERFYLQVYRVAFVMMFSEKFRHDVLRAIEQIEKPA